MADYCATCGQLLVAIHETATVRCCSDDWYWSEHMPLPRDNLVPVRSIRVKGRTFYLYENRERIT
jgi:hypothetical protein